MRPEKLVDFLRFGWTENRRAQSTGELGFVQRVIAAQQHQGWFVFGNVNECFDL